MLLVDRRQRRLELAHLMAELSVDIAQLIEETVGGGKFAKEMASLSGTWYAKFVQEVNNVKEQRDAELAQIMVCSAVHDLLKTVV